MRNFTHNSHENVNQIWLKSYFGNIGQTYSQINIFAIGVKNKFWMAQQQQCKHLPLFQMVEITNNWHNKKRALRRLFRSKGKRKL